MKFYLKILLVLAVLKIASGRLTDVQKMIHKAFNDSGLVPGIIPKAPMDIAYILYRSKSGDRGSRLSPADTEEEPSVTWPNVNGPWFTVVMIDPDAPSKQKPTQRFWQHWTVANIPGHQLNMGERIAEYIGPMPPPGSGPHRYVVLVYKQQRKQNFYEVRLNYGHQNRGKWSLSQFVQRNNLGDPVAGNYFISENK